MFKRSSNKNIMIKIKVPIQQKSHYLKKKTIPNFLDYFRWLLFQLNKLKKKIIFQINKKNKVFSLSKKFKKKIQFFYSFNYF
jgi:hypothetical protein